MATPRAQPARSQPRRNARTRRRYREPDSESDFDVDPDQKSSRPARSSRQVRSYRETSDSDDSDLGEDTSSNDLKDNGESHSVPTPGVTKTPRRRQKPRRSLRALPSRDKSQKDQKTLNGFKRRKINPLIDNGNGNVNGKTLLSLLPLPPSGEAPLWQSLEYQILLQIMQCAAYPLYVSTLKASPSIDWLVGVSRLCKSFHEAATAALLYSPPLIPADRTHGLINVLSRDQSSLTTNYQLKVHALDIEVKYLLLSKSGIHLNDLLHRVPLVKDLRLSHWHDDMVGKAIWATPVYGKEKWAYGNIASLLDSNNIKLRSFEWNGRFRDTTNAMLISHSTTSMKSLREVSIVNFTFEEKQQEQQSIARDVTIDALYQLPDLSSLQFKNCTLLDAHLMSHLPDGLQKLAIINCFGLTSGSLEAYLTKSGSSLTDLHLSGNQVMSLGFAPGLKELCPKLRTLHIDLSYQDASSYRDIEPLFDDLLPHGCPTWPSKLESLIIGPLRTLTLSDAEEFYTSIIMAADDLPYLRTLSLKTLLKEASWRDRAQLRSKWSTLFLQVFLADKTYDPPKSAPKKTVIKEPTITDPNRRKSARIQELEDLSLSELTPDGGDSGEEKENDIITELGGKPVPKHNRCDVVEFELSDQRPAQEQFREEDFLDDELSGDEEWNGRDTAT